MLNTLCWQESDVVDGPDEPPTGNIFWCINQAVYNCQERLDRAGARCSLCRVRWLSAHLSTLTVPLLFLTNGWVNAKSIEEVESWNGSRTSVTFWCNQHSVYRGWFPCSWSAEPSRWWLRLRVCGAVCLCGEGRESGDHLQQMQGENQYSSVNASPQTFLGSNKYVNTKAIQGCRP